MILTNKQEEGLKIAIKRYIEGEKYVVIAGYAGTGKSTLVKILIQSLPGIDPETDVVYTSFTGKATQVLLKKGNKNVSTLHRLLYKSIPKEDGSFMRIVKDHLDYKIVIVDEVSMVPRDLMNILFGFPVFVICLGDNFQLPPVDKNQDNGLLYSPHIFLDEIMRQALDSDIIKLSMKIRNKETINLEKGSDAIVMAKDELNTGVLQWGDQIICATNKTRVQVNNQMRTLLGRTGGPEDGDKVICLHNYWDILADNEDPLVNGTIGYLSNPYPSFNKLPYYLGGSTYPVLLSKFISDSNENYKFLQIDKRLITEGVNTLDNKTLYRLNKNWRTRHLIPCEFAYGYCITGHKSQGSEWDKVVVLEENFPFDSTEHARWLYTAVTRASQKLVLIKK